MYSQAELEKAIRSADKILKKFGQSMIDNDGVLATDVDYAIASRMMRAMYPEQIGTVVIPSPGDIITALYNPKDIRVEDLRQDKPTIIRMDRFIEVISKSTSAQVASQSVIRPSTGGVETRVVLNLNLSNAVLAYQVGVGLINKNLAMSASAITVQSVRFGVNEATGLIEVMSQDEYILDPLSWAADETYFSFVPKYVPDLGYSRIASPGSVITVGTTYIQNFKYTNVQNNWYSGMPDFSYNTAAVTNFVTLVAETAVGSGVVPAMTITVAGFEPIDFQSDTPANVAADILASDIGKFVIGTAVGTSALSLTGINPAEIFSVVVASTSANLVTFSGIEEIPSHTWIPSFYSDNKFFPCPQRVFIFIDDNANKRFTVEPIHPASDMGKDIAASIVRRASSQSPDYVKAAKALM